MRPRSGGIKPSKASGGVHGAASLGDLGRGAGVVFREYRRTIGQGETVRSVCWCERKYVTIPVELVADGQTITCGHRDCRPPRPVASPDARS